MKRLAWNRRDWRAVSNRSVDPWQTRALGWSTFQKICDTIKYKTSSLCWKMNCVFNLCIIFCSDLWIINWIMNIRMIRTLQKGKGRTMLCILCYYPLYLPSICVHCTKAPLLLCLSDSTVLSNLIQQAVNLKASMSERTKVRL